MILTDELKGEIAKKGYSQRKVAKHIGITEKTFYAKMKKGIFGSDEVEKMIDLLDVKNPMYIFFAKQCTQYVQNLAQNDCLTAQNEQNFHQTEEINK